MMNSSVAAALAAYKAELEAIMAVPHPRPSDAEFLAMLVADIEVTTQAVTTNNRDHHYFTYLP
jgi:hypothetical protein